MRREKETPGRDGNAAPAAPTPIRRGTSRNGEALRAWALGGREAAESGVVKTLHVTTYVILCRA
jgi:hypothetical protein